MKRLFLLSLLFCLHQAHGVFGWSTLTAIGSRIRHPFGGAQTTQTAQIATAPPLASAAPAATAAKLGQPSESASDDDSAFQDARDPEDLASACKQSQALVLYREPLKTISFSEPFLKLTQSRFIPSQKGLAEKSTAIVLASQPSTGAKKDEIDYKQLQTFLLAIHKELVKRGNLPKQPLSFWVRIKSTLAGLFSLDNLIPVPNDEIHETTTTPQGVTTPPTLGRAPQDKAAHESKPQDPNPPAAENPTEQPKPGWLTSFWTGLRENSKNPSVDTMQMPGAYPAAKEQPQASTSSSEKSKTHTASELVSRLWAVWRNKKESAPEQQEKDSMRKILSDGCKHVFGTTPREEAQKIIWDEIKTWISEHPEAQIALGVGATVAAAGTTYLAYKGLKGFIGWARSMISDDDDESLEKLAEWEKNLDGLYGKSGEKTKQKRQLKKIQLLSAKHIKLFDADIQAIEHANIESTTKQAIQEQLKALKTAHEEIAKQSKDLEAALKQEDDD
jgi:hypothetical protein